MKYHFKLILQAATFDLVLNGQALHYSFLSYVIPLPFSICGRPRVSHFGLCHNGSETSRTG